MSTLFMNTGRHVFLTDTDGKPAMNFDSPAAAEAAFYAAFRALDLTQMRAVWLDSDAASCIHPGAGLLQGLEAIMASWASIFGNSLAPRVEYRLIWASTDDNLAVHTVAEHVSSGSGQRSALIMATNVYRRSEGHWFMLAHHASLPLVEHEKEAGRESPSPLH